ncbi:uncharacterized protein LOC111000507 [Pieris rapae]|uniref:uncharacterized protein LOC111000507 n=1 Tax=Pieris rapae TaxID=64459 RepID=UPI001E27A95A|nr:uncharacterized protein LOC111000507 [Pieris rapae]
MKQERTMADDSSNDASIVAITSDEDDDSPIKKLFKKLMYNDCKQHTILTNNQILNLLKVEFDIDVYKLHNLEVDIYITLLKKYLKDWPLWEEFDTIVNEAKKANNLASLDGMLQSKYKHLKAHLQNALDISEPMAKEEVSRLKNTQKVKSESKEAVQSVVMVIDATRNQLNSLILRNPTHSVFNVNRQKSTIVVPGIRKIESILNWWTINIEITYKHGNMTWLLYKRETSHELKHCLINKVLPCNNKPEKITLNQDLYFKSNKNSKLVHRNVLMAVINVIGKTHDESHEILEFIRKDNLLLPQTLYTDATYKRYMNTCAYVRYLYKDQKETAKDPERDLQLEEKIFPMYKIYVGDLINRSVKLDNYSMKVKCMMCKVTFTGPNLVSNVRNHFEDHCTEPDWMCTCCNMTFPMMQLASQWWAHVCPK